MALLGLGPRMLVFALSQLLFQAVAVGEYPLGLQAEYPLGPLAESPLRMRRTQPRTQAKRRRLQALAGLGGISDRALVNLLAAVREQPEIVSDSTTRQDIQRTHDEAWESVGQIDDLELTEGGTFKWYHSRPSLVLNYFLARCPAFFQICSNLGCEPRHAHPRHRGQSCSMPMKSLLVQH